MIKPIPIQIVGKVRNRGCTVPECTGKHEQRGLCRKHWRQTDEAKERRRLKYATDEKYRENVKGKSKNRLKRKREDPEWVAKKNQKAKDKYAADPTMTLEKMRLDRCGMSEIMTIGLRLEQGGKCAICPRPIWASLEYANGECRDHFESIGGFRVWGVNRKAKKHPRGLLCNPCNTSLGWYERYQRPNGLRIEVYELYLSKYTTIHSEEL